MAGARVILDGPGKFDYGAPDLRAEWKRWKRGFNSWLIGSEQDAKKEIVKVNLLLTLMGSEGQDIYETLEFTDEQPSLMQVLEQLDSHFAGLSNVTMARFRFFCFEQGGKSVADFVTGLKSLANDCEFGDLKDSLVKDMIVIHCSSEKLRERLLKESNLELAKAVEIARIGEDAERNVDTIGRRSDIGSSGALVAGCRSAQQHGDHTSFRRSRTFDGECFECGEYGHMARDCQSQKEGTKGLQLRRESSLDSNQSNNSHKPHAGYAVSYALGATMKCGNQSGWYIDSGASQHMTPHREQFDYYEPYRSPRKISLGDGTVVRAYGQGEVKLKVRAAAGEALVTLSDVQFVPKLQVSVLSVPATAKLGNTVICRRRMCIVSCGSLRLRCPLTDDGHYEVPTLDNEHGGVPGNLRTNVGCSTPGGVTRKSKRHGWFSRQPMDNGDRKQTSTNWADQRYDYDGTSGRQVFHRVAVAPYQAGGASRYHDPRNSRTKAGGQGYPGASSRNGQQEGKCDIDCLSHPHYGGVL